MRLVVYFDGQFWSALIERNDEHGIYASRHIFGSEPNEGEILNFVNNDLLKIIEKQTVCSEPDIIDTQKINPKRLAKIARKQMVQNPVSTKSQEAIQLALEAQKKEKQVIDKERQKELNEYKRILVSQKKKEKHKGH